MKVPNWQHHSKKEKKRHLKPQALRQAKKRSRQLINRLLDRPRGRSFDYNGYIYNKVNVCKSRSKRTISKTTCN